MIQKQDGCQNHLIKSSENRPIFLVLNGYGSHLVLGTSENRSSFQITI
jgi:hypothetical protein